MAFGFWKLWDLVAFGSGSFWLWWPLVLEAFGFGGLCFLALVLVAFGFGGPWFLVAYMWWVRWWCLRCSRLHLTSALLLDWRLTASQCTWWWWFVLVCIYMLEYWCLSSSRLHLAVMVCARADRTCATMVVLTVSVAVASALLLDWRLTASQCTWRWWFVPVCITRSSTGDCAVRTCIWW